MEIGTVCVKIAGRDAGMTCVIVESKGDRVVVDGETRRKAVNPRHLEPTGKKVALKAGASHADVMKALGLKPRESKPRKPAAKPVAKRAQHAPAAKPAKAAKPKAGKKDEKKEDAA